MGHVTGEILECMLAQDKIFRYLFISNFMGHVWNWWPLLKYLVFLMQEIEVHKKEQEGLIRVNQALEAEVKKLLRDPKTNTRLQMFPEFFPSRQKWDIKESSFSQFIIILFMFMNKKIHFFWKFSIFRTVITLKNFQLEKRPFIYFSWM